jgi:hypothetical protein
MVRRHHRWRRGLLAKLAATLAAGIVLATASQAFAMPVPQGPGSGATTTWPDRARALRALAERWQAEAAFYGNTSSPTVDARPDDRAGVHAVDGQALVEANGRIRGIAPAAQAGGRTVTLTASSTGSGIDVRAVSIGVAIGLGVALTAASLLGLARGARRTGPDASV